MWNQQAFSTRLKLILYYREMTQKTLARRLKVAQSTVSAWQRRPSNFPDLSKLIETAKVLKVPVCWLAFGCPKCMPKECDLFIKQFKSLSRP